MKDKIEASAHYARSQDPLVFGHYMTLFIIVTIVGNLTNMIIDHSADHVLVWIVPLTAVMVIRLLWWWFSYYDSFKLWWVYGEAAQRLEMDIKQLHKFYWEGLPVPWIYQFREQLSTITKEDMQQIQEVLRIYRQSVQQAAQVRDQKLKSILGNVSTDAVHQPVP